MKKIMIVAVSIAGLLNIYKSAWALNDWEYWSHYEVISSVSDNIDFKVKIEVRFNDNFSNHYYSYFDIGVDWKLKEWFIFSPYYQHINQKVKNDWLIEYRPHLDATFKRKFFNLDFSDRNRMEYRVKQDKKLFIYRNKLTAKLPKLTQLEIQPYTAIEVYYDFDTDELNKNQFYIGTDLKVIQNLKAGIYYIFESRKNKGGWTNVGILGSSLTYSY